MTSKRKVKRTVHKSCISTTSTIELEILQTIKQGYSHIFQLRESLKITKQRLNYYIQKLVKIGLIRQYAKGTYDLTDTGKKIHATYEENKNKQLIQLENMRYILPIYGGFDTLMECVRDPKKAILNNGVTQYTGKIKNLSVKVITSDKNKSIEVTCEKWVGVNAYEIMYDARRQVEDTFRGFFNGGNVKLGYPEQSMSPEWAIPHPIAEIMLKTTDSSQIRCGGGVINRSSGRNADWEVDNVVQATRVMNMPNVLDEINQKLTQQQKQQEETKPPYGMYM